MRSQASQDKIAHVGGAIGSSRIAHPSVVILEDDTAVRTLIGRFLNREFNLIHAESGIQLLEIVRSGGIDLVLLDILLPGEDGLALTRSLSARSLVPVILISGLSSADMIVTGLSLGAVDYVTKPFHPQVLQARIRNALRRSRSIPAHRSNSVVEMPGCRIDTWSRVLTGSIAPSVRLTEKELQLLMILQRTRGTVVHRNMLSQALFGEDWSPLNRSLDVHMSNLRRKLAAVTGNARLIKSFRGIGYGLADVDIDRMGRGGET